ncbi:hypothetical protein [Citrobacter farmeri]|uniref:hypothetical protein n=1 Tax=Citrobacter farmeri TaxID=67824 RepID=UPI00189B4E1C|nr:hypothetical protein [Citrobacter farmeri]MDB2168383.1 hypothetical protein [Citrobacter farmeri]
MISNFNPNQPMKLTGTTKTYSEAEFRIFVLDMDKNELSAQCKILGWSVEEATYRRKTCLLVRFSKYYPAQQEKYFESLGMDEFVKAFGELGLALKSMDKLAVEFELTGHLSVTIE